MYVFYGNYKNGLPWWCINHGGKRKKHFRSFDNLLVSLNNCLKSKFLTYNRKFISVSRHETDCWGDGNIEVECLPIPGCLLTAIFSQICSKISASLWHQCTNNKYSFHQLYILPVCDESCRPTPPKETILKDFLLNKFTSGLTPGKLDGKGREQPASFLLFFFSFQIYVF